eukprot:GILI01003314.1.p1 GENE.GILI01003314.1~~GILI01003314.1.p1  ORF type:complete len:1140 (+),score=362.22 GILI01003314.1:116-3535(+)
MKQDTRKFFACVLLLLLASELVITDAKAIKMGTSSRLHPLIAKARVEKDMNPTEFLKYMSHIAEQQNVLLETASSTGLPIPVLIMIGFTTAQVLLDGLNLYFVYRIKKRVTSQIDAEEKVLAAECMQMRLLKELTVQQFFRSSVSIKSAFSILDSMPSSEDDSAQIASFRRHLQESMRFIEETQAQVIELLDSAVQRECEFMGEMAMQLSSFINRLNKRMDSLKREIALSGIASAISIGFPLSEQTTLGINIALNLVADHAFGHSLKYRLAKVLLKIGAGVPTIVLTAAGKTAVAATWLASCQYVAAAYSVLLFAQSCMRMYDTWKLYGESDLRLAEAHLQSASRRAGQCSILSEASRNQALQFESTIAVMEDLISAFSANKHAALPVDSWVRPWASNIKRFCAQHNANMCLRLLRSIGTQQLEAGGLDRTELVRMARLVKYGPITDFAYSQTESEAEYLHKLGFVPVHWMEAAPVPRAKSRSTAVKSSAAQQLPTDDKAAPSHQAIWVCRSCGKKLISDVMYTDRDNLPTACKTVCASARSAEEEQQCAAQCHSVPAGDRRYLVYVRPLDHGTLDINEFASPKPYSNVRRDVEDMYNVLTDLFVDEKTKMERKEFEEKESIMSFSNYVPVTAVTTLRRSWDQKARDWFLNTIKGKEAGHINPGTSVIKTSFFAAFKPLSYRWEERRVHTERIYYMITKGLSCRTAGTIPVVANALPAGFNPSARLLLHRVDSSKQSIMTWISGVDLSEVPLPEGCERTKVGRVYSPLFRSDLALLDIQAHDTSDATKGDLFATLGYTKLPIHDTDTVLLVKNLFPDGNRSPERHSVSTHQIATNLNEIAVSVRQFQQKISATYSKLLCSGSCTFSDDDASALLPPSKLKFPPEPTKSKAKASQVDDQIPSQIELNFDHLVNDELIRRLVNKYYEFRKSKESELKLKEGHIQHAFFKITGFEKCGEVTTAEGPMNLGGVVMARRGIQDAVVPLCANKPLPDGYSSDGARIEELYLEVILSETRKGGWMGKNKDGMEDLEAELKKTDIMRAAVENGFVAFKPHEAIYDDRMPNRDFFGNLSLEGYRSPQRGVHYPGVIVLFRYWIKKDLKLNSRREPVCGAVRSVEPERGSLLDAMKVEMRDNPLFEAAP